MIIGREVEIKMLNDAYNSEYSEFVAVYGRRRVGKTFLIREAFNYSFTFEHSGLAKAANRMQLHAFRDSLVNAGLSSKRIPSDWLEAFALLMQLIKQSTDQKKVIFIDEIPWMDQPRSNFVTALEYFWNSFASARKDVLLIICGSATSWIINKVLKNHGGLHNRVTYRIALQPFTLHETEAYLQSRGIKISRYDTLEYYMVFGGVPFYLSMISKGESVAQNIDRVIFSETGPLHYEFNELYDSLFDNPDPYLSVVTTLGHVRFGMTRKEIIAHSELKDNGKTTRILEDLQSCGFIRKYPSYGLINSAIYQLTDNFTLFYFQFFKANTTNDEHFWSHNYQSQLRHTWTGLAFERVCFQHIRQIKAALGIADVVTNVYSWRARPGENGEHGAQIDMLIDRADNTVNLCEMKFSKDKYTVTQQDMLSLDNKAERFSISIGRRKTILLTMVTVYGLSHEGHWGDIHRSVTAEDLFKV